MKRKFLKCNICGNLIEMITDKGVIPTCCNEPMQELTPNTTDASHEKHIPVVSINDNIVIITIGEVIHPMIEEHYIEWLYLKTNKGIKRVNLKPNDEPTATFSLLPNEIVEETYAYCNLHGLWQKEVK